ncbi:T9SS type A sorting domain-containing protein [Chryseobacterium sp. Bi04]|uniref:T9SS type A sorting domain-containing protein n=1 Tax=Chryseobacterium sp. Bi04 TaxID=2822345 RepID=UPI001D258FDB|nr:T9SS type A sorting domain-containing protein [Chryseobacterium sp. Bi04]CAH0282958.1 hypothetical protein SRABI04_04109 [Chryseobacterium sp. Bi04]
MTKKLFLVLLLAVQTAFAQIISKDPTFASNGIYTMSGNNAWSRMIQNPDGSIYFTYNTHNSNTGIEKSFLSKLSPGGIIDTSFGINGELQLPYSATDSQLKKQSDGKLVVFGFSDTGASISRILPNGQLDPTFGSNGIAFIAALGNDGNTRSYGLILQNEKIIVHGIDYSNGQVYQHRIYRLTAAGAIDNTFGNNGSVFTEGSWSNGTFVLTDNQSNIVVITNTGILKKLTADGQPLVSFGNNGTLQMTSSLNHAGCVLMDTNNKIIYSNINDEIFRINADGTPDTTFNYDLYSHSGINGGAWITSIIEKDGYYYIGGSGEGDFRPTHFISKLNQNGSINSNFSYYSETNPELTFIGDMIVNDTNIIACGNGYVTKYLLNNTTLSTTDITKTNSIFSFENPVKKDLVFNTKEKVIKIEIYSMDGKTIKVLKDNNTDVSDLLKGNYIAKVIFESGKTSVKKLIKD